MENRHDLRFIALAFFSSAGSFPSERYLKIGVIYVSPSSSTTAKTSAALMDFSFSSSTNTCLLKCAKLVDAILLNTSAFLFSFLETCFIENALKLLVSVFTFSKYRIMSVSFATYVLLIHCVFILIIIITIPDVMVILDLMIWSQLKQHAILEATIVSRRSDGVQGVSR
ncbi:hypothetical protein Tco_0876319 [Tanacetum coccineum]|uniref:Uncharacterized protein n=1 Tax=Tanacetum coccineum TaxID=301880 RepID=A0ABQ5BVE9_9ASTR